MNYRLINDISAIVSLIIGYNTRGIYCIAVNLVSDTNEKYSHCSEIEIIKEMKPLYISQQYKYFMVALIRH